MTAAEWLSSDEVTEALARIKRRRELEEREEEEAGFCDCCRDSLVDQEAYSCYGQTLCEDCWDDATGGKA